MLNDCKFIGHLGAAPEIKSFQNGGRVANLRLAVTEKWKDKNSGERKEQTEWISIAVFAEGLIGVCEKYLKKGSKIFVQGAFKTRKYQDQSGNDRYSTEIVLRGFGDKIIMLDGASGNSGGGNGGGWKNEGGFADKDQGENGSYDDLNDDLAF